MDKKCISFNLLHVQSLAELDPAGDVFPLGQEVHLLAPAALQVPVLHLTHPLLVR